MEPVNINLTGPEFSRIANNYYTSKGLVSDMGRINIDAELVNYFLSHTQDVQKRYKVAFVWICLNPPYWQFAKSMIEGARNLFLPGHDVDYFVWSDMPETKEQIKQRIMDVAGGSLQSLMGTPQYEQGLHEVEQVTEAVDSIRKLPNTTVFPLDSLEWPYPTLLRYHTFLQQEEILSKYDYIFYCDVDMAFVNIIGDEILGQGLTATMNPMYALDKTLYPPYEPNPDSTAYIHRPGQLIQEEGNPMPRFMPQYYAGGFQGGKADQYLAAAKVIKENIDKDLAKNYIAIWNEESHWNKYLFEHPENLRVLNQSYLYPDSLINEYYVPRWGRDYQPKLVTLTKKFSLRKLSPQEQAQLTAMQRK